MKRWIDPSRAVPRIDPYTGVPVLTHAEMIQRDAERKGTSYEEEQRAWNDDLVRAEQEEATHLRENALTILQEAVARENQHTMGECGCCEGGEDAGALLPVPTEVVEVVEVEPGSLLAREYTQRIEAVCRTADGTTGVLEWSHWHFTGSYIDPPEDEESVVWHVDRS